MLMGISGLESLVLISRGEGGVGIAEDVEFIRDVMYKEWMKVRGGR